MKNIFTLFVCCIAIATTAVGQSEYDRSINAAFDKYRTAFLETDRATLTEMAHPDIIEMGGGKTYYFDELTEMYNMYAAGALKIKDLVIKQASKVVNAGDDLQAMLPYERTFGTSAKDHVEKGYFLVTSKDGGSTWYFTDMRKFDSESIKLFLKNYNERLDIYLNADQH